MRPTWHNWVFRCLALLIFISGGALARAVVQDLETHFALPVREPGKQHFKAVTLEVRQPAPVQLEAAVPEVAPMLVSTRPNSQAVCAWLELHPSLAVVRDFDALAPPRVFVIAEF